MHKDLVRLSNNLKTARSAKGITQPAAGAAVGKTRQTIVNWENPANAAEPSTAELAILARLYDVTPADLRFAELERRGAVARGTGYQGADALHAAEAALEQRTAEPSIRDRLAKDPERAVAAHLETLKAKRPAAKRANGRRRRGGLDSA